MSYTAEQLIAKYVELRDAKAVVAERHKTELEPFNTALATLENALTDILNAQGGQNIKTPAGTAYRTEILNVKVENWDDYHYWVERFGTPDYFVKNANKTAVKEYMEAHSGALPAGISVSTIFNLNVRRA